MGEQKVNLGGQILRWARRLLVLLLVAWAMWLLWRQGVPTSCRQAVAGSNVVSVCSPMATTDPRAVLFVVAIGLLLLPDVKELEVAGLFTLRRRVDEVKQDAYELKQELASIRSEANANAVAHNQTIFNVDTRQEQTGRALAEVEGGDGVFDEDEEVGAYAQLAFEAGLFGLTTLLPANADDVRLIGYTVGDDGRLEPTFSTGDGTAVEQVDLNNLTDLVNRKSPREPTIAILPGTYAVFDFAELDEGLVGALAVVITGDLVEDTDLLNSLASAVAVAAGAYGQLLTDLLGEQPVPHSAGANELGRGQ